MCAAQLEQQIDAFQNDFNTLRHEMGKRIVGQQEATDGCLTALFCGGHVLLEGVPGLGKTQIGLTLAEVADLALQRIQFTPDLMPADILGTYVIMETAQGRRTFEFQQGPLFTNLVLADHINRGTPKTQSALLEAMEADSVSVARERFELPQPFCVLATQNPQEMEGTFPLPEAELDRFLFKFVLRLPSVAELDLILQRTADCAPPTLRAVVTAARILEMRGLVRQLPVPAEVRRYAIEVTAATQPGGLRAPDGVRRFVRYGASPRAAQGLVLAAKVQALAAGRAQVAAADVRQLAPAVLRHRLALTYEGQGEESAAERVIENILQVLPAPPAPGVGS